MAETMKIGYAQVEMFMEALRVAGDKDTGAHNLDGNYRATLPTGDRYI